MLKPPACSTNDATEKWVEFADWVFNGLNRPGIAIALVTVISLLVVIGLRQQRYRRWVLRSWLALLGLLLLLPLMGSFLLTSFLPPDTGEFAEAVVVLGRGVDLQAMRSTVAQELLGAGRAPMIFVSGKYDAPILIETLQSQGIDKAILDGEACSRTTSENARYTAQVLIPQGVKRIILVTDPPHMWRAYLTFRRVGFEVIPHPSPLPINLSPYDVQSLAVRESISFITYGLLGRY